MLDRYNESIHDYVLLVINRMRIQDGIPSYEASAEDAAESET